MPPALKPKFEHCVRQFVAVLLFVLMIWYLNILLGEPSLLFDQLGKTKRDNESALT